MPTQAEVDTYLRGVIAAHTPANANYVLQDKINELNPHIFAWANGHGYQLKPHGSISKKGLRALGIRQSALRISIFRKGLWIKLWRKSGKADS